MYNKKKKSKRASNSSDLTGAAANKGVFEFAKFPFDKKFRGKNKRFLQNSGIGTSKSLMKANNTSPKTASVNS